LFFYYFMLYLPLVERNPPSIGRFMWGRYIWYLPHT
jgi:hypothetical protein